MEIEIDAGDHIITSSFITLDHLAEKRMIKKPLGGLNERDSI
jgi:hypothetical protein